MKNMQRHHLKIIILSIIFCCCLSSSSFSQTSTHRLTIADSLFKTKRYTQSFEQYKKILDQKQYTPTMLLKMAYIQEGLSNIGKAMFYLNLYFIASNDKSVLTKMETMAEKYKLHGYETSDADQLLSFYHDYHLYIGFALAAACCFMISLIIYTKRKTKRKPIASGIFSLLFIILFFIHINYGERITTGIISLPNTLVMEGPSAGAPVDEVVDEGHRVEILGTHDVWLKVKWNHKIAYIKNNNVLTVQL
jgi:hypothetical protein